MLAWLVRCACGMRSFLLFLTALLFCACGVVQPDDAPGARELQAAPGSSQPQNAPLGDGPRFLAFTLRGDLALADGAYGTVLATARGAGLVPRDLVYDRWKRRVIAFEQDGLEDAGEIATWPLPVEGGLGPRRTMSEVDGDVRLAITPVGLLLFEESHGHRWRMLRDDGAFRSSIGAPLPKSIWADEHGGYTLHALVRDESWMVAEATVEPELAIERRSLPLDSTSVSEHPILLPAPALGGEVLVDAGPVLHLLCDGEVHSARVGRDGRVAQALSLEGGNLIVIVSDPARLEAVALTGNGHIAARAQSPIPGRIVPPGRMFDRVLVALDEGRVLVASDVGVFAFEITHDAGALRIERDTSFRGDALRGPMAVP